MAQTGMLPAPPLYTPHPPTPLARAPALRQPRPGASARGRVRVPVDRRRSSPPRARDEPADVAASAGAPPVRRRARGRAGRWPPVGSPGAPARAPARRNGTGRRPRCRSPTARERRPATVRYGEHPSKRTHRALRCCTPCPFALTVTLHSIQANACNRMQRCGAALRWVGGAGGGEWREQRRPGCGEVPQRRAEGAQPHRGVGWAGVSRRERAPTLQHRAAPLPPAQSR